ncbi:MAG: alpha/beta hydrolase [Saprospiraceae bacterium]|nr:alpha/beta hydrolase [Saprospiraceae bacterium]
MKNIRRHYIKTSRLTQCVRFAGRTVSEETLLFIHGNASSSVFWTEIMRKMPLRFRSIAPDLRGYGDTDDMIIDATKGMGDFVEDLVVLINELAINKLHLVGHSMGGSVIWRLLPALGDKVRSITLINPGSPYGFGGTKDTEGSPCFPDFAGSGGGIVNPQFAKYIAEQYRGADDPLASPRVVMNNFYWKPPFKPTNEEALLDSLLSEKIGSDRYPGDFVGSSNYPFVAPGVFGPANALSPKYVGDSVKNFIESANKPPVLWVRGSDDQIVSDNSLFCMGTLGKMGLIPNYPSEGVYPPQPMVSQSRAVLEKYAAQGGHFQEVVMPSTGHSPYIEQPAVFLDLLLKHVKAAKQ